MDGGPAVAVATQGHLLKVLFLSDGVSHLALVVEHEAAETHRRGGHRDHAAVVDVVLEQEGRIHRALHQDAARIVPVLVHDLVDAQVGHVGALLAVDVAGVDVRRPHAEVEAAELLGDVHQETFVVYPADAVDVLLVAVIPLADKLHALDFEGRQHGPVALGHRDGDVLAAGRQRHGGELRVLEEVADGQLGWPGEDGGRQREQRGEHKVCKKTHRWFPRVSVSPWPTSCWRICRTARPRHAGPDWLPGVPGS